MMRIAILLMIFYSQHKQANAFIIMVKERKIGMPKIYVYFGMVILFYSNEHGPVHVHGKYQGKESKAELIVAKGF